MPDIFLRTLLTPPVTVRRSTVASYRDASGNLAYAAIDVARTAHYPGAGGGPLTLLENPLTNPIAHSEGSGLANSSPEISFTGSTGHVNTVVAPDGTTTANHFTENATTASHQFFVSLGSAAKDNTAQTVSCFLKAAERTFCVVESRDKANSFRGSGIDLAAGTVVSLSSRHTIVIEPWISGWWRIATTFDSGSGATALGFTVYISQDGLPANETYLGDGTSGLNIWGLQHDVDARAMSSYTPSKGTPGTRAADIVVTQSIDIELRDPTRGSGNLFTAIFSGALAPAGDFARSSAKTFAGALAPVGTLARQTAKVLSGALTPIGALIRKAQKALAGSVSPSGALTRAHIFVQAFAGSLTPSGALIRSMARAFSGALTPSGTLSKRTGKTFAGTLAPSGVVSRAVIYARAFAGTLTPSGALVRQTGKVLAGALTPSGALARQIARTFSGNVSPAGALVRQLARTFAGAIAPSGTLARSLGKTFAGSITPSGVLTTLKSYNRAFTGAIAPAGALARQTGKTLAGTITPAGALLRQLARVLAGALTPSGAITKLTNKIVTNYTRASTATYWDASGVVQTAAINEIRHGHYVGGVQTTLVEAQGTNLAKQSEDFTASATWTAPSAGWSVTTDPTLAPDGTSLAQKIVPNTTNNVHPARQNLGVLAPGATYTVQVRIRAAEYKKIQLNANLSSGFLNINAAFFDTQSGGIATPASGGTVPITSIVAMQLVGSWWYCTMKWVNSASGSTQTNFDVYVWNTTAPGNGSATFAGDGTSGIYISNVQVELNDATSYIHTTTALVTRAADVASNVLAPVGALTTLKMFNKAFTGAIAPAGALVRQTAKFFSGAITPAGTLARRLSKTFTGALTPSGALAVAVRYARTFAGSLTPSATLAARIAFIRTFTGTLTPSGALSRARGYTRTFAGALAPAGSLLKSTARALAGAITPSGALSRVVGYARTFAGSVAPAGELVRQTGKRLAGSITPSGVLSAALTAREFAITLAGALAPVGSLVRQARKALAGVLAPVGTLARSVGLVRSGAIAPAGTLNRQTSRTVAASLTPAATADFRRVFGLDVDASLVPEGSLFTEIRRGIASWVTFRLVVSPATSETLVACPATWESLLASAATAEALSVTPVDDATPVASQATDEAVLVHAGTEDDSEW